MSYEQYAAFLPDHYRTQLAVEPTSTWWDWRGRRIHIARAPRPQAPLRMLLLHGGGGYSTALWPLAALVARAGVEVIASDLPLYGDTVEPRPESLRYDDWVDLTVDLVRAERRADDRPLMVFGASMGGMLGYEAAARTGDVAHVLATCLLDPRDPAARRAAARMGWLGRFAPALMRAVDPVLGRVRIPIRWLVNMGAMSGNAALSRLCATDPKGGGVRVPLGFLASWLNFAHTAPEQFTAAPVTLLHPAADRWTPPRLSIDFLHRIPGRTEAVLLDNCGHYPVEEPGLGQLEAALTALRDEFVRETGTPPSV